jgi:DNA-binding SARP family transcriptional activator
VLGPIQVVSVSGCAVDLPSVSQRRLLARLAVDAPRALRVDLLCEVLGVSPGALRTIVSRLRKGFGDTAVIASQGRYRLAVPVDAALFTTSLSRLGTDDDRIGTLERALALWTGPPFEEFSAEDWAGPEATRLAELHASAIEDHAAELIGARRWPEAIAGLRAHVSVHPLRDRPWGLLVQALGGAGRQADALAAFGEYRAYLAEWTGTEPSAEVCRIQQRIAAGWDGTEETPPPSRGNDWLPLQAELLRGPAVIGRAREVGCWRRGRRWRARRARGRSSWRARRGSARRPCWARSPARYETKARRRALRALPGRPAVPLEPFRSLIGHVVEYAPAGAAGPHRALRRAPGTHRASPGAASSWPTVPTCPAAVPATTPPGGICCSRRSATC